MKDNWSAYSSWLLLIDFPISIWYCGWKEAFAQLKAARAFFLLRGNRQLSTGTDRYHWQRLCLYFPFHPILSDNTMPQERLQTTYRVFDPVH